jgi:hypothetical protein
MPPLNAAAKSLELPHVACRRRRSRERFEPPLPGVCVELSGGQRINRSVKYIQFLSYVQQNAMENVQVCSMAGRRRAKKTHRARGADISSLPERSLALLTQLVCQEKRSEISAAYIKSHNLERILRRGLRIWRYRGGKILETQAER